MRGTVEESLSKSRCSCKDLIPELLTARKYKFRGGTTCNDPVGYKIYCLRCSKHRSWMSHKTVKMLGIRIREDV